MRGDNKKKKLRVKVVERTGEKSIGDDLGGGKRKFEGNPFFGTCGLNKK